jgi:hypothetical protein
MNLTGKLKESLPLSGGEWLVTFTTRDNPGQIFDDLKGEAVKVEIKKASKMKSRDANAYCWVIIDKISEKTGISKSEVYRHAIKEIGGVSTTICVQDKAVDLLRESWERKGLGWQTDTLKSRIDGCTNVILYYGSSMYNSQQMSRLIDSLVQEAEGLGIPTYPEETERMKRQWQSPAKVSCSKETPVATSAAAG